MIVGAFSGGSRGVVRSTLTVATLARRGVQ
jgi:hypothetical protein